MPSLNMALPELPQDIIRRLARVTPQIGIATRDVTESPERILYETCPNWRDEPLLTLYDLIVENDTAAVAALLSFFPLRPKLGPLTFELAIQAIWHDNLPILRLLVAHLD